jgi:hypothetical protein
MVKTKRKRRIPATLPDEGKRIVDHLDEAILGYSGQVDELAQALGFYLIGRHVGWRALVIMHNKRTIRKYEEILGIDIRIEFAEEAGDADRSMGYRFAKGLSNFWRAVSGDERVEDRRTLK